MATQNALNLLLSLDHPHGAVEIFFALVGADLQLWEIGATKVVDV